MSSDGTVLFATPWHGGEPLLRVNVKGGNIDRLVEGPTGVGAFDEGGGRIVYALVSVPDPNELYVREKSGQVRQLTDLNAWVKDKELANPQERWITRPDGLKVQYWVMNPAHAESGKRYPWVLEMHGGPSAMWGPGEFSMWWEFQLFCAWGYGVTYANPRGSGGYGYEFQKANYRNWGKEPIGRRPRRARRLGEDRAPDRQGWPLSYRRLLRRLPHRLDDRSRSTLQGGVRAARRLRSLHFLRRGQRVAAGARRVRRVSLGARNAQPVDEESPITYVANIRTPFLIIHGSQDLRTGFAQSEMLFRSLKQLNRPVEYVRYPSIGHELTRSGPPLQRMDHMLRIIEFFERYANNTAAAPVEQKDASSKSTDTAGAQQ